MEKEIKKLKNRIEKLQNELEKYLSPIVIGKVYDLVNYNLLLEKECNK